MLYNTCVRMEFAQVHVVPPPSKLDNMIRLKRQQRVEARYSHLGFVVLVLVYTYAPIAKTRT